VEANESIILFDGVCNLCNRSVQFIIRRDKKNRFRFAAIQGKTGQSLMQQFQLTQNEINSFLLIEGQKIYTRSTAALRVFRQLGGLWSILYVFIIVPPFIRDVIYNWVARNRYKWYGKRDACMIPSDELKSKFLE
jgi:predicted DCC family thiol-disulfide oxidoreductase YuxK